VSNLRTLCLALSLKIFLMFAVVVVFLSYIVLCSTFKSSTPFVLTFLKVLGLAQSSYFGYGYSIVLAHIELF